jgi:hypothetical protein
MKARDLTLTQRTLVSDRLVAARMPPPEEDVHHVA